MSFILDALKKSETDRQQQASAEFSNVPTGDHAPRAPRWLWLLGGLLAINLVVLLGLFLRAEDVPAAAVAEPPATSSTRPGMPDADPDASFASQIAEARRNAPARLEVPAPVPNLPAEPAPEASARARPESRPAALPTFYEVVADGTLTLPDLHLDIHVYSETPDDRFVFINMSKQRENSRLREGPTVEEITPEGVVLEYRGTTFLLPRE